MTDINSAATAVNTNFEFVVPISDEIQMIKPLGGKLLIFPTNLRVALCYGAAGIPVFPCDWKRKSSDPESNDYNKVSKAPLVKGGFHSATADETQIREWWTKWPDALVGLGLPHIGLIAVDADRHGGPDGVAALRELEAAHDIFEPHPITITHGGGHHDIFKQPDGEPLGNGEGALPDGINMRGDGYIIAPGCVITDEESLQGRWAPDKEAPQLIESFKAGTIPVIPQWLVDIIRAPKPRESTAAPSPAEGYTGASDEQVRDGPSTARTALERNCAELAACAEGGRDNTLTGISYRMGRMVAAGWIAKVLVERRLFDAAEASRLVASYGVNGAEKIRDTIARGMRAGMDDPMPPALSDLDDGDSAVKVDNDGTFYNAHTGEVIDLINKAKPGVSDSHKTLEQLTRCDGLVGEIVDWIEDSARRPNRILALGAAVTVIGTLIGRRVAGPTESATHLYVLGLAGTAAGKQHIISSAKRLLEAAGASTHIGPGRFTTGPAISNHIEENPLSLCCQDEFGSFIARITDRKANGWEREASIMYRELWGHSFERYDGMRWANRKPEPIQAPALSILGLSTPGQFYSAIKSGELENGFINRFLLLSIDKLEHKRTPTLSARKVPENIESGLQALYNWRSDKSPIDASNPHGNWDPDVRPWASPNAEAVYNAFDNEIDERMFANERLEFFIGRSAEMAVRLATIRAAGRHVGDYDFLVDASDIEWGMALVRVSSERLIKEAGELIGEEDTPHSRASKKVEDIIRQNPRITHSALVMKVKHTIEAKVLKGIIETLKESETIIQHREAPPKGGKPRIFYEMAA